MAFTPSKFSFGDVLLVPFPFTDQLGIKKRPGVVVSNRDYNAKKPDIVILTITSQVRVPLGYAEAMISDWQVAGLIKSSVFKPVFTTIEQNLVLRVLGRLSESDAQTLELLIGAVMRQSRTAQQNF